MAPVSAYSSSGSREAPGLVLVLDACVLISNVLRHLCLGLAREGIFMPAWSAIIGDEWARNASRLWQVPVSDLHKDWSDWQHEFPLADQADVQTYKVGLKYSDPKDWHVIAAARAAQVAFPGCNVHILTKNVKDFNRSELKRLGLSLLLLDAFLDGILAGRDAPVMMRLLADMPGALKAPDKPPLTVEELLKRERLFCLNRSYQRRLLSEGK
ncbi:PIN domain-containing protein [Paenalcaligenes niemegkensis]|uniref:PIN domain-containing protein n=1 Tax=Paenalcaligenes niemegkensis TaxID=2895469 RepID=UPI001EE84431|nr:PIN domain-containing protein [Paenalcaligenes niemegkensis]MCQ9616876.1 PIN domain-containing protein [Paenalcaligenes niemegkensis]